MALRKIVCKGDETLRKKSRRVGEINERISLLIDDMWETLEEYDGIGLAAPQVGVLRRVVVIDTGEDGGRFELINPELVAAEGMEEDEEGCLSIPGVIGMVPRPERVTVRAQDRGGATFTIEGEGMLARALSHELDHLDGVLFIDRATKIEKHDPDADGQGLSGAPGGGGQER
ncbi:MAG: peptide deformylase [Clostridiales Family XIII bacterium]|jgi:peptide deformylase|nr:peptide deformylase [Clostridiales Family XIII bacterium]